MRLLVELSGGIDNWARVDRASPLWPRLPLPFASAQTFVARGHEVSAITFAAKTPVLTGSSPFRKLYGPHELNEALQATDLAFLWASAGIKAVGCALRHSPRRNNVLLASYVWQVPRSVAVKIRTLGFATRAAARVACGVVLMTEEQVEQAARVLGAAKPVIRFTWGIDSRFYLGGPVEGDAPPGILKEHDKFLRTPYFILAGDQQRLDQDAVELVARHGLRLVRVPQEARTAAWYRAEIATRGLQDRILVCEKVDYLTLRWLLKHAIAYLGLVDSTWQPAGWTVLSEAFACGISAIIYDGLTAREMRRLGAADYLTVVPHRNCEAMAHACERIASRANTRDTAAERFAATVLDLDTTARHFVDEVEQVYGAQGI
jgi:hypothetical protein